MGMMKGKWVEKERFYATPTTKDAKVEGFDFSKILEELAFGKTTILFTCECGEFKTIEILEKSLKEKENES